MRFPPPSTVLLQQTAAEAPRRKLWPWVQALPHTIQRCLDRWQLEWTGEPLKQGHFGYVLPCRRQDGTAAVLKLSPCTQETRQQGIALAAWAGGGVPRLLARACEGHGGSLLLERVLPGATLRPRDDPEGRRIAQCLQRLAGGPAFAVRGPLPFGPQRLMAQLRANARHLHALSPAWRRGHEAMVALGQAIGRSRRASQRAVLLHGDLHAGNLLVGPNGRLVAIDPSPALGEPEQDLGDAAAKNDWGQALSGRVERLAEACGADPIKARAYARLAAWNCGVFHIATGAESPGGVDPAELLDYARTEPC
jgi:streptomycin 6-kinase